MTRANSELMTPEHVRSAVFSPARLGRRGLDESEVRAFCGWVSDELTGLLNENTMLQGEVLRLRGRVLETRGKADVQPEDAHVQAVYVLSKAQQTADRYVAEAQEYSRELAEDARLRRDEILREAKVRASVILEEAHASATQAARAVGGDSHEPLPGSERQELQAEIAYLRTFSDVCRTHLRAYMESLSRSIEEWERAEHEGARTARASVPRTAQKVLCPRHQTRRVDGCNRHDAHIHPSSSMPMAPPRVSREKCRFRPAAGHRRSPAGAGGVSAASAEGDSTADAGGGPTAGAPTVARELSRRRL